MSIKDRLEKLEAKLTPARIANSHNVFQADMQYIFDKYGNKKMLQIALDDEAGSLSDDDKYLIAEADNITLVLQKQGGMIWLCRMVLRLDREV